MMRWIVLFVVALALWAGNATARTLIAALPGDIPTSWRAELVQRLALETASLAAPDELIVYDAKGLRQVARIAVPVDPRASDAAWRKRKLGEQFAPVRRFIEAAPASSPAGEIAANLRITDLADEIGRNLVPSLPDKTADILLIGSWLVHDARDGRFNMLERYYPSDGHLKTRRTVSPFGVVGREDRLAGAKIHFCWPDAKFVTQLHEESVRRWWSLWTAAQGGRIGTFSTDLSTCFNRARTGETSGQAVYEASADPKVQMLRSPLPMPAVLPLSYETPGEWFLHEHVNLSKVPPSKSTGMAWIGIRWDAPCDLDIWARGDSAKPWLFFNNVQTAEGRFNKDWTVATDRQFEFVEFQSVDLSTVEVAVNLYAGQLSTPPEGVLRVWMDGKVFEAPFRINATRGNSGAPPMTGSNWVRIDIRRVVGLGPR